MPFAIHRHAPDLIWVEFQGRVGAENADAYYHEMWQILDASPPPTDMVIDGRRVESVSPSVRTRTDQVSHHPHLGHVAFVIGGPHLLLFAPLVKMVSGVGLFGSEREALRYLRESRGQPRINLFHHTPPTLDPPGATARQPARPGGLLGSLNSLIDGWTQQINTISRTIEGD